MGAHGGASGDKKALFFYTKMKEITCLYTDGKNPVERPNLMMHE